MYGKHVNIPIETYTIINDRQCDFGKYVSLNYNYIGYVLEVNVRYYIKRVQSVIIIRCVQELRFQTCQNEL